MTSQISKFVDSPKTQKSEYLDNETFFLQIKRLIPYKLRTKLFHHDERLYLFGTSVMRSDDFTLPAPIPDERRKLT